MQERRERGGSLLWYTVQMVEPGQSIHLIGYSFPEWGGPAIGHVTDTQLEGLRQGWTELFTDGLKRHCEAR